MFRKQMAPESSLAANAIQQGLILLRLTTNDSSV